MSPFIAEQKPHYEDAIKHFKTELAGLRTGRANPSVVENIPVQAYGGIMEIKALASINVPDAKTIVIDPWDKSVMKDIEKAITDARIGTNPIIDGTIIRLSFPSMTEETRRSVVKMMKEKLEEARVAIRKIREMLREEVLANEKSGKIGEDERFRMTTELDDMTKEFTAKLDVMTAEKEKEIMTI
ncbi:MAG: ribosome recycling factor [bacterium]